MKEIEYKDKVINKNTNEVVLNNVFAYFDEDNEIYLCSDNILLDDGETKVSIYFTLTEEGKPLGLVYNTYFDGFDILQNNVSIQEAYDNYKKVLSQNILNDMNKKYDRYKTLNKKFIALHLRKKGKDINEDE